MRNEIVFEVLIKRKVNFLHPFFAQYHSFLTLPKQ
jgi:hypothetical protein